MADKLETLGFVGFGTMPRRIAARPRDASYTVVAFDIAHPDRELDGFRLMVSPEELAGAVDAILVRVAILSDRALLSGRWKSVRRLPR